MRWLLLVDGVLTLRAAGHLPRAVASQRRCLSFQACAGGGLSPEVGPGGGPSSGPRPATPSEPTAQDAAPLDLADCPQPSEWPTVSLLSVTPPTDEDRAAIEGRQLGHKVSGMKGVGRRCRHGVPQAFAFDPLVRHTAGGSGKPRSLPLDTSLFRLSCPMLVKAIDEWEGEGAVAHLNEELAGRSQPDSPTTAKVRQDVPLQLVHALSQPTASSSPSNASLVDPPTSLARALDEVHAGHAAARLQLCGEDRLRPLLKQFPDGTPEGKRLRLMLASGVAGQLRYKLDVKCLHAQTADHLCRSTSNEVGVLIFERLEARGVDVSGTPECFNQCNLCQPVEEAVKGWWYTPTKNKWKLRKKMVQRQERKRAAANQAPPPNQAPSEAASSERNAEAAALREWKWGMERLDKQVHPGAESSE